MLEDLLTGIARDRAQQPERVPDADDAVLSTAEVAECTCPDFCERDHENE